MINVTKPYLPSIHKYKKYVDQIYKTGWLTNDGPLIRELEDRLKDYLGVKHIVLVANGTLALQIAYRLLDLKGDVITSPFSFVATSSSLVWENLNAVFADINRNTFNIEPSNIVDKINHNTSAIVPVHVFGNACDVEAIDEIAKTNNLKVIYDAAHAFAVKYKDKSILNYGDISTLSFHATKLFHTIEGGAIVLNDGELYLQAKKMINFGFDDWEIKALGVNAKMNEFQAAMGLCHLDDINHVLDKRKELCVIYKEKLDDYVEFQTLTSGSISNYSYFPILLDSEELTLSIIASLNAKDIYPRRYFHPSLDTISYISKEQEMEISRDISNRILCLPIYPDLSYENQMLIINTIISTLSPSHHV